MLLFIFLVLLPVLTTAAPTPEFSHDISCCTTDGSEVIPISLVNNLPYSVNVTISCCNDQFFYSMAASDLVVLPAFYKEWANTDKVYPNNSCLLFAIGIHSQGYSIVVESAETVLVNTTQSCTYSVGDDPIVNHSTDCKENDSGIFNLTLENNGDTWVLATVWCVNEWFDFYLAPNTSKTVPSVFLEWTHYNKTYPENTCIFMDWYRYQDVAVYSIESDYDYVVNFPGCYVSFGADCPVVDHEVNCPEDSADLFPVTLENKGDVWLYVDVMCWNDIFWFFLAPNTSVSLPSTFADLAHRGKPYPNDTCVFNLYDEGLQMVWVYSEEADWDYSYKALTCNYSVGADTPQLLYDIECPNDDADVSSIFIENTGTVWLYIALWCWNPGHRFYEYLAPGSKITFPVVFQEWTNPTKIYPNNTCVMMGHENHTQFVGVFASESDRNTIYDYLYCDRSVGERAPQINHSSICEEDSSGNIAVNLENTGDVWLYVEVICWNDWFDFYLKPKSSAQLPAQFQDWANVGRTYPDDICVFKEHDWHYQQVLVYSEESDWDFSYDNVGCNYSIGGDSPSISYNAKCPGDDSDFQISLENTGDAWLWVELDCLGGWQNVSVGPHSVQSVNASFERWTNPEQSYSGTCALEAVAAHYQQVRVISWESDWDRSTNYVVCDFSTGSEEPKVDHQAACAVNDSGLFTLNLVNSGDVWLYTELKCWNGLITVYMPPRSSRQIPAAYNEWNNPGLNYASDICLFEDWGKTQDVEIYNEETDFDYSYTNVTCDYSVGEDVLRDHHTTDCRTDNEYLFSVTLRNPGGVWLYVFLRCSNDNFRFFLEPDSFKTVPAAINTDQYLTNGTCVFHDVGDTAYAYTYTEEPDWDYTERQLRCS